MAHRVRLNVSVEDPVTTHLPDIQRALEASGMTVHQVLDVIGIISGEADEEAVDRIRGVAGVAHVEPERAFQLPPPESDVQ